MYIYIYIYIGGWGGETARSPNREIVSFRVVRARGAYVMSDPGEKAWVGTFPLPFSISPCSLFPCTREERRGERSGSKRIQMNPMKPSDSK